MWSGALLFALVLVLPSCARVPAYDRGKLAHPTMTTGTFAGPAQEHVHAVQEGAIGGGASAESGCGCN